MAAAAQPTWSWGDLGRDDFVREEETNAPDGFDEAHFEEDEDEHPREEDAPPQPQKHYPSRTCRICLEEVLPTFEIPTGAMPSFMSPTPKVRYVSEDPESGRLIRPCKCRGTQKYVHEGCLKAWRHSDNAFGTRTFWECPTCKFKYNLERMKWGRLISSTFLQIVITVAIMFATVFVFGFVADPIINLYLDPFETITSLPSEGAHLLEYEEDTSWAEHFLKGLASLGLLGFVKVFFAMSRWNWWNLRRGGFFDTGHRGRRGTGNERLADISWTVVIIGVVTFLAAVWTWVRAWTRRTLESAEERVVDVQGDDEDEEDEEDPTIKRDSDEAAEASSTSTPHDTPPSSNDASETELESKKDQ